MTGRVVDGRVILVAEDDVISAHNVKDARARAETEDLSTAVFDINLAGEDCSLICQQLSDRSISFMFHAGLPSASLKEMARHPTPKEAFLAHHQSACFAVWLRKSPAWGSLNFQVAL